jgi:anaerobic magnesium-protoporphyrin IX monomethyl ester cyclase
MTVLVLEHPRVRSEKRFNDIANTPLWSCLMGGYAAAAIQQAGHEVHFLDATPYPGAFEETEEQILDSEVALLAINAVYFWEHTGRLFDSLSRLRRDGFKGHINLFGFFPTLAYQVILQNVPAVDSITVGECEHTLAALADRLGKGVDWRDVPGLAFRDDQGGCMIAHRSPENSPDRFAFPLRDPAAKGTASILAARGCYNHCSFCPVPVFYNDNALWRGRTPENVLEEMTELMGHGYQDFYFVDPNFIGPGNKGRSRALELAGLMRPLDITFGMETRPNDLDEEVLEHLASAGLQSLLLGIESASSSVLGQLDKRSSRNFGQQAINLCRSVGIEPEVGFLMFVPDSTTEDLAENLDFLLANNLLDRLDRTANLLSHCQIVLMGTPDYRRFSEQGRLTATGPLGFEGEISFADHRVKWVSELVVHSCLSVLRDMSRPESPLWWRTSGNSRAAERINRYLVNLFKQLLGMACKGPHLPPVGTMKTDVENELQKEISRAEYANRASTGESICTGRANVSFE